MVTDISNCVKFCFASQCGCRLRAPSPCCDACYIYLQNQDDDLYKRDFSAATLEDHFDKTILPKVMQVKNFGRSGRTKYTHLVDQDTTQFDSPWISETAQNLKFHNNQAAGMKQVFDRPSVKRSK